MSFIYSPSSGGFTRDPKGPQPLNSVLNFGADATGNTDSTQAFVDCLSSYDTIVVPLGTYLLADLPLNGKKIIGAGTIKRASGATYAVIMQGESPSVEGLTFSTLASAINNESEIKLDDSVVFPTIINCTFKGTLYACVSADSNGADDSSLTYINPAKGLLFTNNVVEGSYSRHLYLHSVEDMIITNNRFKGSLRDSIRLRQATRKAVISKNTFEDIGESYPNIVERPQNWSSLQSYNLDDEVSVPPFGIFKATAATTTIGANPATTGAGEWTNIAPGYFETKDAVDGFWSTLEFIFTENIVSRTGGYGLDLKGSEPQGNYSSQKMIISNNVFEDCFIGGINLFMGDFLSDSSFRYVSQVLITSNVITGCNRERFDVSESPIKLRGGLRGVTISNNIIERNYARAINISNVQGAKITKDVIIQANHIYSNGIPGNPSAVGINASSVDSMIIKDNIIKNLDKVREYTLEVSGTASSSGQVIFQSIAGGSIIYDYSNGDTPEDVLLGLEEFLIQDSSFNVTYDTIPNSRYYTNVEADTGIRAFDTDFTDQIVFTSKEIGSLGNGFEIEIQEKGTTVDIFPQAQNYIYDSVNRKLIIETRSTTRPFHLITSFNGAAPPQVVKDLLEISLAENVSPNVLEQSNLVSDTLTLAGGVSNNKLYFDARLENQLDEEIIVQDGLTFSITKDPNSSNSVQEIAMNLKDYDVVGQDLFVPPLMSYIISDNYVNENNQPSRFSILYNNVEIPTLLAYVGSDNSNSNTVVTTQSRTLFTGGQDSSEAQTNDLPASLNLQGILLWARQRGSSGNKIAVRIDQQTDPNQPLRVISAPAYIGGSDIWIRLPTDANSDPVDTTVAELENLLKQRLGQGILSFENNFLDIGRPNKEGVRKVDLANHEGEITTDQDVVVFRDTTPIEVGQSILDIQSDLVAIENSIGVSDPSQSFEIVEHWLSNTAVGNNGWTLTANSGVVGMNISVSTGLELGICRLDTLTSSISAPTINLGAAMWLSSTLTTVSMTARYNPGTLATVVEDYIDRFGFMNSTNSTAPTNGVYFEYNRGVYGSSWNLVSVAGGTATVVDTLVNAVGSFNTFQIVIDENSNVKGFINGVEVAEITTNIPTGTSQTFSPTFQKVKTAGTTARVAFIDWCKLRIVNK